MKDAVASTKIIGIRPSGERMEIVFAVGRPYLESGGDLEQWRCPVSLEPLQGRLADAAGADSIQSICMALALGLYLLRQFKEEGGKLLHDDDTEFPLTAYLFGRSA
jgi:hypothetical protein